jgi:hypothetical protein
MGKYVPTTSVVHDKTENDHGSSGNHYSVMEMIPNARHFEGSKADVKHLTAAKDSGDLDKLAIMNLLLGNTDRHGGNYMISPKGVHMIDHGFTFDFHGQSGREHVTPRYLTVANGHRHPDGEWLPSNDIDEVEAHPEAVKWLSSLDPKQFQKFFKNHKVSREFQEPILNALHHAKTMIQSKKGARVNIGDILDTIRDSHKDYAEGLRNGE